MRWNRIVERFDVEGNPLELPSPSGFNAQSLI